jgi:broad specificity phosphatase PhoE
MTESTTRITLVRHGHVHNPDNLVYGRLPGFRLSTVGRKQAALAAARLSSTHLAALFCSPQLRAQETGEHLLQHHPSLSATDAPLLDEIDCYFEGQPIGAVEARGWDLYTGVGDGYETPADIAARASSFLLHVRRLYVGQHIAAVSHGDVIAFLVLWAMKQPIEVAQKRTLGRFGITDSYPATASLTTLTYHTSALSEIPDLAYIRPYGDDLALATLS